MRKRGFTLVEVLLSMAIVGVVAALAVPSISKAYQKKVLTTQLQRAYAEITQAAVTARADEMVKDFRKSRTIKDMTFIGKYLVVNDSGTKFADSYGFYDQKNANYNFLSEIQNKGGCRCGVMKSGAALCITKMGTGILDINGDKGPNLIGRDAFSIGFNPDGTIDNDYSYSLESIIENNWDLDNPDGH